MKTRPIANSLGETLLEVAHPCGLVAVLNPKPGFARTFADLGVCFGSLDATLEGADGPHPIPAGVAHFLEHKLFEDETGDVSLRFSSRGASCNAATEFTKTSYHFSCSDQLEANVETLLGFVLHPYFTEESVNREQGIIEQEIRMYDDDPDWVIYFRLLESMYHRHPVRHNIAGTVESIAEITPELLYRCHRTYYHPANLVLAVSGGFEADRVLAAMERALDGFTDGGARHQRGSWSEPPEVSSTRTEREFAVSRPQVSLGFKDPEQALDAQEALRRELATQIGLDILFSQSSPYYQELYEGGIIDDSFSAYYTGETEFGFSTLGGESDDPEQFESELLAVLERSRRDGIAAEDFQRARNRFLGRFLRAFNSPDAIANALVNGTFRGVRPDDMLDVVRQLRPEELSARLAEHLREERHSLSILWPTRS